MSPITRVYLYSAFMSISTACFGLDTGTIGAITTMKQFETQFGALSDITRGLVVSCILLTSAFTGIVGGTVSDRLSRKRTTSLGCAIFAVGMGIACGSSTLGMLIAGRCIAGLGEGLFLSCVAVYISEISPAAIRGRTVLLMQVMTTGAIAAGFFICYGTARIDSSLSWRFPFALSTLLSTLVAIGANFLPYSPRWLMLHGRRDEAETVLDLIATDLSETERKELLTVPAKTAASLGVFAMFGKGVRGRTALGAFLQMANQLSGIDFVLFFAPLLFTQAGLDPSTSSFVASGVTGILLLVSTIVSTFYIDRVGRRRLWIIGGLLIGGCHYLLGALYASGKARDDRGKWVVIITIELFAIAFVSTWAAVIRLYSSEIQARSTRAAASAFGNGVNQAVNFVVALTGPGFLARSAYGPYFTYGSCTFFATFVAYLYMPETMGKSLEAIETSFEGSPYAVQWPERILSGRKEHVEQTLTRRRASRESQKLPGETRAELRAGIMEMERLGTVEEAVN
ncbi:general substrate transporter [Meredithblackwellia eburnea MCA 4105]